MKAVRIYEHGGPEVIRVEDVPIPEPGEGQVRIKVAAASVNFADMYIRRGPGHPSPIPIRVTLPCGLGADAAGTVDSVGADVEGFEPNQRVAGTFVNAAYAEYALASAKLLVGVPTDISLETAAAVLLSGLVAHYLAETTYPLRQGDVALVHAASGSIGLLLVQLAKRRGAVVIGTVSSEAKAEAARNVGADLVINYTTDDFASEVLDYTQAQGVHVVYDSVGKEVYEKNFKVLRKRGMFVNYGQASGPLPPLKWDDLRPGSFYVARPKLPDHISSREEFLNRARDIMGLVESGDLKVKISRQFSLDGLAEAHRLLEERKSIGKAIIVP